MSTLESVDGDVCASPAALWQVVETLRIDPVVCSFLQDHEVGGTALLPTVLQLDLVAAAARGLLGPGAAGLRLSAASIHDPVRFPDDAPQTLTVVARPVTGPSSGEAPGGQGWDVELRGAPDLDGDAGATHLRATLAPTTALPPPTTPDLQATAAVLAPVPTAADLAGTADLVYPPLFHGPAFQVIHRFGRDGAALVAVPDPQLTPWRILGHGGALPVQLLELVLQACGVWELAETGRMMRPSRIAGVVIPAAAAVDGDVVVRVAPRPTSASGDRVFDGVAIDAAGRVLLQVVGYQPVELGTLLFFPAQSRINDRIGPHRPASSSSEGAQR